MRKTLSAEEETIRKAEAELYRVVNESEDWDPEIVEIWNDEADEPIYFDYFTFYNDAKRLRHVAAELECGLLDAAKYVLNAEIRAIKEFDA